MKLTKLITLAFLVSGMSACTIAADVLTSPKELKTNCKLVDATPIAQIGLKGIGQ